eukprot:1983659-Prymnesium_polylepis.3
MTKGKGKEISLRPKPVPLGAFGEDRIDHVNRVGAANARLRTKAQTDTSHPAPPTPATLDIVTGISRGPPELCRNARNTSLCVSSTIRCSTQATTSRATSTDMLCV